MTSSHYPAAASGIRIGQRPRWREAFARLSLVRRFSLIGGIVLLAAALTIGFWVARQIEHGATKGAAAAVALYIEGLVAPAVQGLRDADRLAPEAAAKLDAVLRETAPGGRVVSLRIWKPGGLVAHASDAGLVGRRFAETDTLRRAWSGEVVADFRRPAAAGRTAGRATGHTAGAAPDAPLLQVSGPVRRPDTGKIIAVAEIHARADRLAGELAAARRQGWLVVGLIVGSVALALFGVVAGGGRMLDARCDALERRVGELARLADQNRAQRLRAEGAAGRAAEMNERHLRRLASELQDGPARRLTVAAVGLESLDTYLGGERREAALARVRSAIDGAVGEIGQLCSGLAAPELQGRGLGSIIDLAVDNHRSRTASAVAVEAAPGGLQLTPPQRICVYRFVQEALSNAFRHAGGRRQAVAARLEGEELVVTVSDRGPGLAVAHLSNGGGLGLAGLKDRIESLGGRFRVRGRAGRGTQLVMTLPLHEGEHG